MHSKLFWTYYAAELHYIKSFLGNCFCVQVCWNIIHYLHYIQYLGQERALVFCEKGSGILTKLYIMHFFSSVGFLF